LFNDVSPRPPTWSSTVNETARGIHVYGNVDSRLFPKKLQRRRRERRGGSQEGMFKPRLSRGEGKIHRMSSGNLSLSNDKSHRTPRGNGGGKVASNAYKRLSSLSTNVITAAEEQHPRVNVPFVNRSLTLKAGQRSTRYAHFGFSYSFLAACPRRNLPGISLRRVNPQRVPSVPQAPYCYSVADAARRTAAYGARAYANTLNRCGKPLPRDRKAISHGSRSLREIPGNPVLRNSSDALKSTAVSRARCPERYR